MTFAVIAIICRIVIGAIYAQIEGFREAWMYYAFNRAGVWKELHPLFTWQRVLFFCTIFLFQPWYVAAFIVTGDILSFSFWHNGRYFMTRNDIDPKIYKERFKDHSTTSTAKYEFNFSARLFFFIVSFIPYSAAIWLKVIF